MNQDKINSSENPSHLGDSMPASDDLSHATDEFIELLAEVVSNQLRENIFEEFKEHGKENV
ncbi:MAG TPA: hypothetical protein VG722_07005 [Tepidisphaeraceae bacterium]|nr:hypothetical protein [Tepidisphaeraceae bacterium]